MSRDREIVQDILNGNSQRFAELVKSYQRPLYYLAMRMLQNSELADEITQKTFLKGYRALEGFQFKSSLKTWFTAIALNLCRTELSKKKRIMVEIPEQMAGDDFEKQEEGHDSSHRRQYLKMGLEQLPQRQKEVVTLRIYQELPFKEIAEVLNSTESAVKVNFHHAMKSLKNWIAEKIQEETL